MSIVRSVPFVSPVASSSLSTLGGIGVGLLVEIRSGGRRITTSPVIAITTEPPPPLVH